MTGETPLARTLKARIRAEGPLTVRQFMDAALNDRDHGYYRTRAAIGAAGDFITAPEITQVFGEIVGLWAAVVWQTMGSPSTVRLVEIGPGRGTLLSDLLRVAAKVPGFSRALDVHLIESNKPLVTLQKQRLEGTRVPITWHDEFTRLPGEAPCIVVANEFLDTCPARQFVRTERGWSERGVSLDAEGDFCFVADVGPADHLSEVSARKGDIFEVQDFGWLDWLAELAHSSPTAALFFDYGHMTSSVGDTLQALKAHAPEHPLASPGEADLTVHVDFEAFARNATIRGFEVDGPAAARRVSRPARHHRESLAPHGREPEESL